MTEFLPRLLITIGIFFIIIGLFWLAGAKIGIKFGSLPGDIKIERPNFSFYFPITTIILLSLIFSLLFWLFGKLI